PDVALGVAGRVVAPTVVLVLGLAEDVGARRLRPRAVRVDVLDDDVDRRLTRVVGAVGAPRAQHDPAPGCPQLGVLDLSRVVLVYGVALEAEGAAEELDGGLRVFVVERRDDHGGSLSRGRIRPRMDGSFLLCNTCMRAS